MPSRHRFCRGPLRLAAWLGLALVLALASPALAAPGEEIAAAKAELSALLQCLETALSEAPAGPAQNLPPFASRVAAAWLDGEEGPVDLELARQRCRPRYVALAAAYVALGANLEREATQRAARIYERRILPRALEISICLLAAESALANEDTASASAPGGTHQ